MVAKPTLDAVPPAPKSDDCKNAWLVLEYAHETAESFLQIFSKDRSRGQPSRPEQDLLRAMLVFASAGLDSMIKHLVKDALPAVIDKDVAAHENFQEFVERTIKKGDQPDYKTMADILVAENPINRMLALLVNDLTAKSLQSVEELFRVASYFNIESKIISQEAKELREVFRIRNDIIHEMDVDFSQRKRNRTPRQRDEMIEATNRLLKVCKAFLNAVDDKLQQPA